MALAAWGALSLMWGSPSGVREVSAVTLLALPAVLASRATERVAHDALAAYCLVVGGITAAVVIVELGLGVTPHGGHGNANRAGLVLGVTWWPAVGAGVAAFRTRHPARHALGALLVAWGLAIALDDSRTS